MYLTKSDFKVAQTCPSKLYYKKCRYPSLNDDDEYLTLLAEGGFMVQKIATLLYPEGTEMPFTIDPAKAADDTLRMLEPQNATVFEATIISGNRLARVDILRKFGNELHLIEVKAASYDTIENDEAIAAGRPNLFRSKGGQSIVAGWREYLEDVTFQVLILQKLFPAATVRAFLLMPDKSKTTLIDELYSQFRIHNVKTPDYPAGRIEVEFFGDTNRLRQDHFLTLVPVDMEVGLLSDEVEEKAERYEASLNPRVQKIVTSLSIACKKCEYRATESSSPSGFRECWGNLADVKPHILDLYHVGSVGRRGLSANRLICARKVSLFDIPQDDLVRATGRVGERNKRQIIQIDHTRENVEWFSSQLREVLKSFQFPLHFIDFETSALAIPYHAGMCPYEPVAFQWSCHTLESADAPLEHAEWINVQDGFPNFEFVEMLMKRVGDEGTIFTWASHENTILGQILKQMDERGYRNQDLSQWLRSMIRIRGQSRGRLVDMNQLCLKHYFHPLMNGRTSIKSVCDAIWKSNSALRNEFSYYLKEKDGVILSPYAVLSPVNIGGKSLVVAEGTGAVRAYEAMMYGEEKRNEELKKIGGACCFSTVNLIPSQWCSSGNIGTGSKLYRFLISAL